MAQFSSVIEQGNSGQLLALVDFVHAGTLNDGQRETPQALRTGILAGFASLSAGMAEGGNGSTGAKAT